MNTSNQTVEGFVCIAHIRLEFPTLDDLLAHIRENGCQTPLLRKVHVIERWSVVDIDGKYFLVDKIGQQHDPSNLDVLSKLAEMLTTSGYVHLS